MALPELAELVVNTPLYQKLKLEESDKDTLVKLSSNFQIDCYCVVCKKEAVHKTKKSVGGGGKGSPVPKKDWMFGDGFVLVTLYCARCNHNVETKFIIKDHVIQKFGQLPSIRDFASAELKKYRKILDERDYNELSQSVGLLSHGVGIGAFVYLRRIFERLIAKHANEVEETGRLPEGFATLRMSEKISKLKAVLPDAVYEYRSAYSILSKGIHELSEDECNIAHPIIYAAIRMILDEEIHLRERKMLEVETKKAMSALQSRHI